ncbi:MAG: sulfate/thiosulfate transport system substrate-binding protein [Solirubrobacterales bacterium]|jgi:sulfate transport system substrate-binding protein|nr:sulfate/thiosulfate transport system substrate-binding protein [Solirubrobacterales bacterium]
MRNARTTRRRSVKIGLPAALLVLLLAVFAAGCGGGDSTTGSDSGSSGGGKLDVVGYSTPEAVYTEAIEPAFEESSKGAGVSFSNSFGASGDQSRAVAAGQPASVVHFAQGGDMERLVEEGEIVAKDWNKQPYDGIAQNSVVVITVRSGNPEGIKSFEDVLTKDVDVVTPNPFSSGAARWNIMAVYGSEINAGKSPDEALAAVKTLLEKAVAQPGSARDALSAFTQGQGDVLLGYENEAIKAEEEGEDVEYVIPPSTIQIETPIAVTKDAPEPAAQDFLDFIWSDAGQEIWAENGYRPVDQKLVDPKQFPTPDDLFTIDQFGGWGKVNDDFFDDETGSVAEIEKELGVSTSG